MLFLYLPYFRDPPEHFGPNFESIDPKFAAVKRFEVSKVEKCYKWNVEKTPVESLEERKIAVNSIFNQIERLNSEK